MHTIGRTNKITLNNIVHLTREHHFNSTLVPLLTEHYILTNTRIAATILNAIVRNKFNNISFTLSSLQCFDAVGWAAGRASGL